LKKYNRKPGGIAEKMGGRGLFAQQPKRQKWEETGQRTKAGFSFKKERSQERGTAKNKLNKKKARKKGT